MQLFTYTRPSDISAALNEVKAQGSKFLAGGTNLVDLMKTGTEQPAHLVDISRLPLNAIEENAGGLRIGATVRNSDAASHSLVLERYPVLSHALLSGASPQIRNMATVGGNLLQRTRCYYFYDSTYDQCNKRAPGSGCAALHGQNRIHAILGASDQCIATYPGDMAVALTVLDARIVIRNSTGERSVPIQHFYRLPGTTPEIENDLKPGELITAVDLPAAGENSRSHYLKVRDRNSFAFALVSVAAVVEAGPDKQIRSARFALGGVAHIPWRSPEAEAALRGQPVAEATFRRAAEIALQGARPQQYNGFKIELARRSIVRALMNAAGGEAQGEN